MVKTFSDLVADLVRVPWYSGMRRTTEVQSAELPDTLYQYYLPCADERVRFLQMSISATKACGAWRRAEENKKSLQIERLKLRYMSINRTTAYLQLSPPVVLCLKSTSNVLHILDSRLVVVYIEASI